MGEITITERELVAAFNEWMRRYVEEPDRFSREFKTVAEFVREDDGESVPSYGKDCTAYLLQIRDELAI